MKKLSCLLSAGFVIVMLTCHGQAGKFSNEVLIGNFLKMHGQSSEVAIADSIIHEGGVLAFIYRLNPQGYIIKANDLCLPPFLAYSFKNQYIPEDKGWKIAIDVLKVDIINRLDYYKSQVGFVNPLWNKYMQENLGRRIFQQWPEEGTTSTGGWLETNYKQTYPYNILCPMDLNTGNRSIAGCPAVAMAQVLNYHKETNNTQFNDDDDYYHNYGSNNRYWIDDDYESRDFPSFPELNQILLNLQINYDLNVPPNDTMIAALNFSCGVACRQVYSSSISGTFGIEQAYDAYLRFSFDSIKILYPEDSSLNRLLADNMKIAMPAHLGLVNPEGTAGHNLVVDGYNTDEYYHFNFGWGGNSNGWYTMPPTEIPYNLTIIEGLILDINKENIHVGKQEYDDHFIEYTVYPNPATNCLFINSAIYKERQINIYTATGKRVLNQLIKSDHKYVDLSGFDNGIYILSIIRDSQAVFCTKILVQK